MGMPTYGVVGMGLQVQELHGLLAGVTGPKAFVMTGNAGAM
jgi:hypothetical protein